MTELEKYIHTYFGVNKEDVTKISSFFKLVSLKKGDYFLKTGRQSDRLGFVQSGIVRDFVFQQPARWNFQAFTDSELYVIDSKDYQRIGQVIPRWAELEKLFIAKCFTVLEDRIVTHLAMTAEERYNQLFNFNKELFNQVPLQYLASMLGMTPETFSRIRKKAVG
jgi:CRP/FNR family transcriptional regulator, anaerobic regulatory protein